MKINQIKNINETQSIFSSMFIGKPPPLKSPRQMELVDTKNNKFRHQKVVIHQLSLSYTVLDDFISHLSNSGIEMLRK